ncbi:AfsR/SARP family transcriptional regulator [Longispora albida]|uniref:AfsR/SARP family transcriptional regulator n=1 Tax=Longispora albida TaxID=203523 RepID=UPI00035F3703|nr:AfsR/SARP family transcriptional regulator [Longispora albida]
MMIRVLGSLLICGPDGAAADVPAAKPRTLLAALLLRPGEWVRAAQLVSALWENPPRSAAGNLRTYVWQLRALLTEVTGRPRLDGRPGWYRLDLAPGETDAGEFTRLGAEGCAALARGEAGQAVTLLSSALALWRGEPYEDVPASVVEAQLVALRELRWATWERLAQARLALGEAPAVVAELRPVLITEPYREQMWILLIQALTQLGRRAEALAAYREVYTLLGRDLGLEPGKELQAAHRSAFR